MEASEPFRVELATICDGSECDFRFPLAALKAYADALLAASPRPVEISIAEVDAASADEAVRGIAARSPHLAGFSCFVGNRAATERAVRRLKRAAPGIPVVIGGPEVYGDPAGMLRGSAADFVVFGEGEETFTEMCRRMSAGAGVEDLLGLGFRDGPRAAINGPRPFIDLSRSPSAYLAGLMEPRGKRWFLLETARGCPYRCSYCMWSRHNGRRLRAIPEERIRAEVRRFVALGGAQLTLADSDLFVDRERAKRILRIFHEEDPRHSLEVEICTDPANVDAELARLVEKKGLEIICGVQSVNRATLRAAGRPYRVPAVERGLRLLQRHAPSADFAMQIIHGLPGDTPPDYRRTLDWALTRGIDSVTSFPLQVLPGSVLAESGRAAGLQWEPRPPYLATRTRELSPADLRRARRMICGASFLLSLPPLRRLLGSLARSPAGGGSITGLCDGLLEHLESRGAYDFSRTFSRFEKEAGTGRELPLNGHAAWRTTPETSLAILREAVAWAGGRPGAPGPAALARLVAAAEARVHWSVLAAGPEFARLFAPPAPDGASLLVCWAGDVRRMPPPPGVTAGVLFSEDWKDARPDRAPFPVRDVARVHGRLTRVETDGWGEGYGRVVLGDVCGSVAPAARRDWLARLRRACVPGARLTICDDLLGWPPSGELNGPPPPSGPRALKALLADAGSAGWTLEAPPGVAFETGGVSWRLIEARNA
ncbi:MAG: B12-binding domain-containing radical SAM protein [Elusimicrobia bacterium]|nr:B12-binding domain-containing radical SAM protein [Elusimicrobiota bacterium]